MTNREAIEIMQAEQNCVQRNISGKCNRDCAHCDLLQDDAAIITAYDRAIAALEKQEPKAPPEISWEYDYFKCPSCGKLVTGTIGIDAHKYCLECGQAVKMREG